MGANPSAPFSRSGLASTRRRAERDRKAAGWRPICQAAGRCAPLGLNGVYAAGKLERTGGRYPVIFTGAKASQRLTQTRLTTLPQQMIPSIIRILRPYLSSQISSNRQLL